VDALGDEIKLKMDALVNEIKLMAKKMDAMAARTDATNWMHMSIPSTSLLSPHDDGSSCLYKVTLPGLARLYKLDVQTSSARSWLRAGSRGRSRRCAAR
jgi:hypothetical protein